jgi:hypothetical protein
MLRICFLRKHKTLHALWTASKVRAMVEHNWIMHVSSHGEAVCKADLALLLSEQPQMQCDELGNDDVELGDLSEDEEGHLFNARPVIASKSSALVTIGGHRVPRGKVAALISLKIRRVLKSTHMSSSRAFACDENDFLDLRDAKNSDYNFSGHTVPIRLTRCWIPRLSSFQASSIEH